MLEILAACMEELEIVPPSLLDTLLMSLTPQNKDDNLRSYQLAHVFLKRCFAKLQQPISLFLNTALTRQGGEVSEVEEYIFPLIYELHKVNPGIMLYVFPNVSIQLQAEDSDVRSTATGNYCVCHVCKLFVLGLTMIGFFHQCNSPFRTTLCLTAC